MGLRLTAILTLLAIAAGTAGGADLTPREIWPQATSLARDGDYEAATAKVGELVTTGKAYGLKSFPVYASAVASMGGIAAAGEGGSELLEWSRSTANALDSGNPGVAFISAERAAAQQDWMTAARTMGRGFVNVFTDYRTRVLARADLVLVLGGAIAATAIIFAIALFIRYGRSMAHDFREILGTRLHGGSVSVLAFALLFLPVFLWLGPMWLLIYWLIIFFGYANGRERAVVIVLSLLVAALPLVTELAASWVAGVESPVVMSAISSAEKSYQPDALRRMQELVAVVPDDPTLHILTGNLNVFEGNELQAADHYRRAIKLNDDAGAHVNLGNLHFLQSDYPAALNEYNRAEERDPTMAIAYYNSSVANGELYRFDQQGQKLEQAKRVDSALIERLTNDRPTQKIALYHPPLHQAWAVTARIAREKAAPSLFGTYASFDPVKGAMNPVTLGALATLVLAPLLWLKRRRAGYAGSCIKCGRTFCHRCKSARESSTYCTQCIHIYLKRDGVALATKRAKLDEVSEHSTSLQRRNRLLATFLPGSAQLLEARTFTGLLGLLLFFTFVLVAIFIGRLAPAIGPVADTAHLAVRVAAIFLAVVIWLLMSLPVYRRRAVA
ncbi:MAG TPA: tetratricopeptide repeat protein [Thermoanaerobaculia bacterium]|nr:tetratricopeptide repeat protein [Thermoanaerobaculia bacterium]